MLAATGFALLMLPALASAFPVSDSLPVAQPKGLKIALTKRDEFMSGQDADVDALHEHANRVLDKMHRGMAAYEKNTGKPHPYKPYKPSQKQARGTADVALTDFSRETLWYGTIDVGTPPLPYTVDFDTGSSDLILPGSSCAETCQGLTIYTASLSATSYDLGLPYTISYGDGSSTSGDCFRDHVAVGGLTAVNQTIGVARSVSQEFTRGSRPSDGMLGMAFPELAQTDGDPFFQTLVKQNQTDEPVFSIKLAKSGSELTFGGMNSALYTGDFAYANVSAHLGWWNINVDSISNNGSSVNNVGAIIDTGTTMIVGTSKQVNKIYASINGSAPLQLNGHIQSYMYPCAANPAIEVVIGGKTWTISPTSFNKGTVPGHPGMCMGGLISQDDIPWWILGDVFLENVYTVFDLGQTRMGFAALA